MIAQKRIDWAALQKQGAALYPCTSEGEWPWSGGQTLLPFESIKLDQAICYDIFVIRGSVIANNVEYGEGGFLRSVTGETLSAGLMGASLFVHRTHSFQLCQSASITPRNLVWFAAQASGMDVAHLAQKPHQLSLVRWSPGTRVRAHVHSKGEEILVLSGVLRDEKGVYPAGSWLRFYPGSGHAPFAEEETLILLRNGFL